jgi:hypothetical protein
VKRLSPGFSKQGHALCALSPQNFSLLLVIPLMLSGFDRAVRFGAYAHVVFQGDGTRIASEAAPIRISDFLDTAGGVERLRNYSSSGSFAIPIRISANDN